MMKSINKLILPPVTALTVLAACGLILDSCQHESEIITDIPEICFESQVLPIFRNSCALSGCHDGISDEGDYVFDSYHNIIEAVSPGSPENSKAYTSLINIWSDEMMPPDQPLSLENRTIIRLWIEQGARLTVCPDTSSNDTTVNPVDTATWVNPRACFERDILPVMQASCAISGCHDAGSAQDGVLLTDYTNIRKEVIPGNPGESELYQKLIETESDEIMPPPPYSPLPRAQIDSIFNWIRYGALNEYCGVSCDTSTEVTFSGNVWPIINQSCYSCHSGSSPSGGVSLTAYAQVSSIAASGRLKGVLRASGYPLMPPGAGLSDCKIRQIEIWIENGYPDN